MKYLKYIILISFVFILFSCKNRYNEAISWIDGIEIGETIKNVKNNQPDFLEIAWLDPLIRNESIEETRYLYLIEEIDGSDDILNMQHFLVFKNGKYEGCESKK